MSLIDWASFSPTERKIFELLRDGDKHTKSEIKETFSDHLCSDNTLRVHIHAINRKIRSKGQEVVCIRKNWTSYYRWVRIISDE